MSDDNVQTMTFELLKRVQASIAELGQQLGGRIDSVEHRLIALERFQSASLHGQQSIMAHLAGIHEGVDDLKAHYRRLDQRMDALEAR